MMRSGHGADLAHLLEMSRYGHLLNRSMNRGNAAAGGGIAVGTGTALLIVGGKTSLR
jgi:hypothetical protein